MSVRSINVNEEEDSQNLDLIIRNGLAGGVAGCATKTIVAPLERVKILFQTSHSHFVTYPLELIRTRLAFETGRGYYSSWLGICRKIYYEERRGSSRGVANFYRGFAPTMLGILPYAGMSFLTHDVVRDWFRSPALAPYTLEPQSPTRLTAIAQLGCGALAGIVAQTVSYPIETIRRRMQVGDVVGDNQAGIVETALRIFRERGARGFYVGLTIGYLKIVPMVATSFYVYDRMKRYLGLLVE